MNSYLKTVIAGAAIACAATSVRAQVFSDSFAYADGEIATVSGGAWSVSTAGTALNVAGGAAVINQGDLVAGRETVAHSLSTPFTTVGNSVAYYGFKATWTALPIGNTGSYFSDVSGSTLLYGRVGADVQGAAAGKFRIAVANANWNAANSVEFPTDLSLNVQYKVVVKYDLATQQTTLWVDPSSEASASVTAIDAPAGVQQSIGGINLRQGRSTGNTTAPGVILIDDLSVATSFGKLTVVPEPGEYAAMFAGGLVAYGLFMRRKASR